MTVSPSDVVRFRPMGYRRALGAEREEARISTPALIHDAIARPGSVWGRW